MFTEAEMRLLNHTYYGKENSPFDFKNLSTIDARQLLWETLEGEWEGFSPDSLVTKTDQSAARSVIKKLAQIIANKY